MFIIQSYVFSEILDWKTWTVRLGAHNITEEEEGVQDFKVVNMKIHNDYRTKPHRPPFIHDIAILQLDGIPKVTDTVSFAPLSTSIEWNEKVDATGIVAGWGKTSNGGQSSDVLRQAAVTLNSATECVNNLYKWRLPKESFICTKLSQDDSCSVSL